MGRLHKRHNWKARQNIETTIDRRAERKVSDNVVSCGLHRSRLHDFDDTQL